MACLVFDYVLQRRDQNRALDFDGVDFERGVPAESRLIMVFDLVDFYGDGVEGFDNLDV